MISATVFHCLYDTIGIALCSIA